MPVLLDKFPFGLHTGVGLAATNTARRLLVWLLARIEGCGVDDVPEMED